MPAEPARPAALPADPAAVAPDAVRPIRVLFLAHTGLLGGAEIMLERMAVGLPAHGVEPVVVLGSEGPLVDRLRRAGIAVHLLPVGSLAAARRRRIPADGRLVRDGVQWVRELRRLVAALDVDVVVTNSQKAHLAGSVAGRLAGVPVVWRMHDIVVPELFGRAQITALRLAAAVGRPRVLGVSGAVDAATRRTLRIANSCTLHNGVDPSGLRPQGALDLRDLFGWPPEAVVFGMIGRLVRWKGGLDLVDAVPSVIEAAPAARFVLVGDELIDAASGFRAGLLDRIRWLGVEDHVRLLPFTDDVGSVLAELDVLVQPSIEPDPFPTAVVEAAVAGVPVVAADHGGVAEIVTDGRHGRLVPPGSVAALAEACAALARDGAGRVRMAEAIKADSGRLTADRMCARLADELRVASVGAPPAP